MGRIDYKKLLEKTRTEKFKLLKKDDPFFDIPKSERIWLIELMKTREAIKTYFPELFDDNVFKRLFEESSWNDPVTGKKRWDDHSSHVNNQLNECKKHLEHYNIDWKRIQDFNKPTIHVCNYDSVHEHSLCKWKDNCQLRSV